MQTICGIVPSYIVHRSLFTTSVSHLTLLLMVRSSYSFTVYIAFSHTHTCRCTHVQHLSCVFSQKSVTLFNYVFRFNSWKFYKHSNCEIAICVNVKVSYCRLVAFHFVVFISFNLNRLCN